MDRHVKRVDSRLELDHQSLPCKFTKFNTSSSKLRKVYKDYLKITHGDSWKTSPKYIKMYKIDNTLLSAGHLKLTVHLRRRVSSVLTQLRTGHTPSIFSISYWQRTFPTMPIMQTGRGNNQTPDLHMPSIPESEEIP